MDWNALLADFQAKLAEATKDKAPDEAAKVVAEATDALPQAARQHLHTLGHAEGVKEAAKGDGPKQADLDAEKARADAAEAKAKKLEDQLAEKQPEVAKVKAEYEAALTAKDQEVQAARAEAAETLKAEREKNLGDQLAARIAALVTDDGYARGKAADPTLKARLRYDDDGALRAYQADGKTPLALATGQSPLDAVLADVEATIPKALLRPTNGAGGSGLRGGSGDGAAVNAEAIVADVNRQYGGHAPDTDPLAGL